MKISQRDILALTILLIVGLFYLSYTYAFNPLLINLEEAKSILEEKQQEYDIYNKMITNNEIDKLKEERQKKVDSVNALVKPFLSDTKEENIVAFIRDISKNKAIKVEGIAFNRIELYDTTPIINQSQDDSYYIGNLANNFKDIEPQIEHAFSGDQTQTDKPMTENESVTWLVEVSIDLEDVTYEQVMKFINEIESNERLIYINSADMAVEESEGLAGLSTNLTYYFIAIDKLDTVKDDLGIAMPAALIGKDNPFN